MELAPILQQAGAVAESLHSTMALIDRKAPEQTDFQAFCAAWDACYRGPLHQLERHLMANLEAHVHFRLFLVTAHNFERLLEVMKLELGSDPLADTRVPERIYDLVTEADNLVRLVAESIANLRQA